MIIQGVKSLTALNNRRVYNYTDYNHRNEIKENVLHLLQTADINRSQVFLIFVVL